jgi:hypothetical protein
MRLLPGLTSSEATFSTINGWLQECTTEHVGCVRQSLSRPTNYLDKVRILEIQERTLLLVKASESLHSAGYVCLSHCWGSGRDVVRTTADNVEEHSTKGIRIDLLPLTFRDAVETCRRLQITHIWIDSLCIIQDSDQDWRLQAAFMADIYENARLTIAASTAKNPTEGLFRQTHRSYVGEPLPGYQSVYIRQIPITITRPDLPLLGRGWVFQELSLSPRTIHFLKDEVMWQCQSKREQESLSTDMACLDRIFFRPIISSVDDEDLRRQWYEIVEAYSIRSLTFQKDRLPAIAAMAIRMQDQRSGDRYLAGLWQSSLCFDLLWYTLQGHISFIDVEPINSISARIASCSDPANSVPSWSWASIPYGVHWDSTKSVVLSCVEVLNISYTIIGPGVSGDIKSAEITLRAPLICFDCIGVEPEMTKRLFPRKDELDDRHTCRCTEFPATGKLACAYLYWDLREKRYTNLVDNVIKRALVMAVEDDDDECLFIAIIVKEAQRPGTWIRLGCAAIQTENYFDAKEAWDKAEKYRKPFPPEKVQEYRDKLATALETQTRVITLV